LLCNTAYDPRSMKASFIVVIGLTLLMGNAVLAAHSDNPLSGVMAMLHDLAAKVEKDGESADRSYHEFALWCEKVTGEQLHSIKLDEKRVKKLKSEIEKYLAEIEEAGETIAETAKTIADSIHDAKNAKELREKQFAEFKVAEKDLVESLNMFSRAIVVLKKEMGSGSLAQIANNKLTGLMQVLSAVTDAAAFSTSDKSKLLELVQARQGSDDQVFAPTADAYVSKSGSIVDMLEDMKENADNQLSDLRKGEMQARFVFTQLRAALKKQQEAAEDEKAEAENEKAEDSEALAKTEDNKKQTAKVLDIETEEYATAQAQCMQTASAHEQTVKNRKEELKVLAEATKILEDMTSGAASRTYTFIQEKLSRRLRLSTSADLAGYEIVTLVNRMAKTHHSSALAQLGSRINAVIRYGANTGEDVFSKIKGLIRDLIVRLEKEAEAAATEKAYCDEQLSDTASKEGGLEDQLRALKAQIDKNSAHSAELKDDVKELQGRLAKIAEEQAELDAVRKDEHAAFLEAKKDLELGLQGVRKALSVLSDYYSEKDGQAESGAASDEDASFTEVSFLQQPTPPEVHQPSRAGDAAQGIMQILEMTESDFATSLAKEQSQEAKSESEYEKASKGAEVEKGALDQEVKFKTRSYKALDKTITQITSDWETARSEQAAVLEFSAKIKDRCIAEPESYEEVKKRRQAEMTGLKEALEILRTEAALMQRKSRAHRLRGNQL